MKRFHVSLAMGAGSSEYSYDTTAESIDEVRTFWAGALKNKKYTCIEITGSDGTAGVVMLKHVVSLTIREV